MPVDVLGEFVSTSTVAWVALAGSALFVFYLMLKKYGMI